MSEITIPRREMELEKWEMFKHRMAENLSRWYNDVSHTEGDEDELAIVFKECQ